MRSGSTVLRRGGIWRPFRVCTVVCILATLRHFDIKLPGTAKMGPLIPCERRLQKVEISEIQEVNSGARFGYRDYGRPFGHFSVTLRRFDYIYRK